MRGSPPVVALVSLGTTPGLRHADATLAALLEEAGARCRLLRIGLGPARVLRRHMALVDAVESLAAARAGGRAEADAVISSGATTAFFQRPGVPHGVWFDSPSALNRPGWAGAWQRAAERRSVARARLLMPWGEAGAAALAPHLGAGAPPMVPLGPPVEELGGAARSARDLDAVAYAGWPWKRGLDVLCAAWAQARPPGGRLVVGGVERTRALAWLARSGVPEPPGIGWAGPLPRAEWLAVVGRARVFVNASRREDYGLSQLEALSAGLVLATVASPGAYEALPLARRLAPETVAGDGGDDAADPLAAALAAALALDGAARSAYAERAAELLAPYRRGAVRARLAERVLPVLLASPA